MRPIPFHNRTRLFTLVIKPSPVAHNLPLRILYTVAKNLGLSAHRAFSFGPKAQPSLSLVGHYYELCFLPKQSQDSFFYSIPLGSLTELFCFYYHPYLIKTIERGKMQSINQFTKRFKKRGTGPVAGKAEIWLARKEVWLHESWWAEGGSFSRYKRATPFRREGFIVNKEPDFIPGVEVEEMRLTLNFKRVIPGLSFQSISINVWESNEWQSVLIVCKQPASG